MMRRIVMLCLLFLISYFGSALAADVIEKFPIKESLEYRGVKEQFAGDIAFYWGEQPHSAVVTNYGSFKVSKRTSALGKSRGDACAWAMASALDVLQKRARIEDGNAVINIVSNIKDNPESSESSFSCLAGSVMVNVALKGTVVKLGK